MITKTTHFVITLVCHMTFTQSSNTLHRMRCELVLAIGQQHQARECHNRAVTALARGEMQLARDM
jgi:hypothetical protein